MRIGRRTPLILAAALAAATLFGIEAPAGAQSAFPTINGVDARYYGPDPTCTEHCGPGPQLLVTLTTARTLTITCASDAAIVINGVRTPANCNTLYFLGAYGTNAN